MAKKKESLGCEEKIPKADFHDSQYSENGISRHLGADWTIARKSQLGAKKGLLSPFSEYWES